MTAAVASLGEIERLVLTLHHVEGWPVRDVAAVVGKSVSATESPLVRARQAARETWKGGQPMTDLIVRALDETASPMRAEFRDQLMALSRRRPEVVATAFETEPNEPVVTLDDANVGVRPGRRRA